MCHLQKQKLQKDSLRNHQKNKERLKMEFRLSGLIYIQISSLEVIIGVGKILVI